MLPWRSWKNVSLTRAVGGRRPVMGGAVSSESPCKEEGQWGVTDRF